MDEFAEIDEEGFASFVFNLGIENGGTEEVFFLSFSLISLVLSYFFLHFPFLNFSFHFLFFFTLI